MAKIYTRKGDAGQTGLFTGERVYKNELRLEALGAVDELVSALGLAKAELENERVRERIESIQRELYLLLADIASTALEGSRHESRLPGDIIETVESCIDRYEADLPQLKDFVMPGDGRASAALHLARTVCRRAERRVVSVTQSYPLVANATVYLNRLSDLLFVMARWVDREAGGVDRIMKQGVHEPRRCSGEDRDES